MLTQEAMRKGNGGNYPTLRQALENKKIPERYYGITSISPNRFEYLERLLDIAVLAREYRGAIIETAQSAGRGQMLQDLEHPMFELQGASREFKKAADEIQEICRDLQRR